MQDYSSPIICNSPLATDDSEHLLSVPLSVSDLQLDGHTAAGGGRCPFSVKQRTFVLLALLSLFLCTPLEAEHLDFVSL